MGAIFQNLSPSVTLKMGSRSPKSNQFLSLFQQYSCTSLVKIHPFILEIGCRKATFQSEPSCDLEMGSRSPKLNQFFFMSQQYSCASWVIMHPFLHEMGCRQAIFQQSKPLCDLENEVKVTSLSLLEIHPFILEIGCSQAMFQQSEPSCDLENGVKSPKSNQFFSMSKQYRCTSLVKLHPFIQVIGCRQAIFCHVTLKMGSRSPRSVLLHVPGIKMCRCGHNPFVPSGDLVQTIFQPFPTI